MSDAKPVLPGDLPRHELAERIIRADHAGEYGAAQVLAGQLAVFGSGPNGDLVRHRKETESIRQQTFAALIGQRRVRPSALLPLWGAAGFAVGALSAALGSRTASACTEAVSQAIAEHQCTQAAALGPHEPELRQTIERIRGDEIVTSPGHRLVSTLVKTSIRAAIALSERI